MESKRKREAVEETYEQVKQRHEIECFKLQQGRFVQVLADGQIPSIMTLASVRRYYSDVYYTEDDESTNFISRWIHDGDIRRVNSIAVDPSMVCGDDVYNLWRPFKAAQMAAVDDGLVAELTRPIMDYVLNHIANGDAGNADWILDYMARMVQFPGSKSEMAIWLYGDERCGKSLLFDFMCDQVLGPYSSLQITDQSLRGNSAVHRVCVQVHGVKRLHRRISDLIMLNTLHVRGVDVSVTNLVNVIVTSNNPPAADDIHIAEYKCTVPGDIDGLRAHLARPEVGRAFYQFLLARPLPSGAGFRKFMRHSHPRLKD